MSYQLMSLLIVLAIQLLAGVVLVVDAVRRGIQGVTGGSHDLSA